MNTIIPHHYFDQQLDVDVDEQDCTIATTQLWGLYAEFCNDFREGFRGHSLLIGATVMPGEFLHLYVKLSHAYREGAYRLAPDLEEAVLKWCADKGATATRYGVRYDITFLDIDLDSL